MAVIQSVRPIPCPGPASGTALSGAYAVQGHVGNQILNGDDFMIGAENVFTPEAQLMMNMFGCVGLAHDSLSSYCCSAAIFSHSLNFSSDSSTVSAAFIR